MNPWMNWDWQWLPLALLVWVLLLGVLAWLITNVSWRPPRHH